MGAARTLSCRRHLVPPTAQPPLLNATHTSFVCTHMCLPLPLPAPAASWLGWARRRFCSLRGSGCWVCAGGRHCSAPACRRALGAGLGAVAGTAGSRMRGCLELLRSVAACKPGAPPCSAVCSSCFSSNLQVEPLLLPGAMALLHQVQAS